jgi:hypothetical protein
LRQEPLKEVHMRLAALTLALVGLLCVGTTRAAQDQVVNAPAASYAVATNRAVITPVQYYAYRPGVYGYSYYTPYYGSTPYYTYRPYYYGYTPYYYDYGYYPYSNYYYQPYNYGYRYYGARRPLLIR